MAPEREPRAGGGSIRCVLGVRYGRVRNAARPRPLCLGAERLQDRIRKMGEAQQRAGARRSAERRARRLHPERDHAPGAADRARAYEKPVRRRRSGRDAHHARHQPVLRHRPRLCRPDPVDPPPPAEEKIVAPPPPTPPPAPKPPPPPPKVVVAPPPPPPSAPLPSPPCLEISPGKAEQFALVNRRCRGHTVFAVIETRGAGGETVCKAYSISQSLAVRTAGDAPPRINHECVLGAGPCNRTRLESMFPECDF